MACLTPPQSPKREKLHGRAFYESIGSPKHVLAPMVDSSEWAWRVLSRSFLPEASRSSLLAYSPMLHARLFKSTPKYRDAHFEPLRTPLRRESENGYTIPAESEKPYLDGNQELDRPLFVQFCANDPDDFLNAAEFVAPFCDAVDLNLGCPQGIARKGQYGAFLQEDQDLIQRLVNKLHVNLAVPVTAKMRILDTKEKTLEYAQMLLRAGASIITVHGRQRDQKGHKTGLADWTMIRYLRDQLPAETVIFANGNILQYEDIEMCLEATGADAVMSAEANLNDPSIFAPPPPVGQGGPDYWRGRNGKGGYRMDAVFRRYMNIIYKQVLNREPPKRDPLFVPNSDPDTASHDQPKAIKNDTPFKASEQEQPPTKKRKIDKKRGCLTTSPNLGPMKSHLFNLLRHLVSKHTDIRDALSKCQAGDIEAFEAVLQMVERVTKQGLIDYEAENSRETSPEASASFTDEASSSEAVRRCKRPWFICQSYVRPLPNEALEKGALTLSAKDRAKLEKEKQLARNVGVEPGGRTETVKLAVENQAKVEIPKEGLVCG